MWPCFADHKFNRRSFIFIRRQILGRKTFGDEPTAMWAAIFRAAFCTADHIIPSAPIARKKHAQISHTFRRPMFWIRQFQKSLGP